MFGHSNWVILQPSLNGIAFRRVGQGGNQRTCHSNPSRQKSCRSPCLCQNQDVATVLQRGNGGRRQETMVRVPFAFHALIGSTVAKTKRRTRPSRSNQRLFLLGPHGDRAINASNGSFDRALRSNRGRPDNCNQNNFIKELIYLTKW